jgi:hypothetical protein
LSSGQRADEGAGRGLLAGLAVESSFGSARGTRFGGKLGLQGSVIVSSLLGAQGQVVCVPWSTDLRCLDPWGSRRCRDPTDDSPTKKTAPEHACAVQRSIYAVYKQLTQKQLDGLVINNSYRVLTVFADNSGQIWCTVKLVCTITQCGDSNSYVES